jgi:lipopolysaccharide/colanic/teichoic acid biosynthesis glycosyltransferase
VSDGARLADSPGLTLPGERRVRGARRLKRVLDVVGATVLLLLLAPVLALVALALLAEPRGPVLFRQERIGRHGRSFAMWKFRTMVADAERLRGSLVTLSRDPDWLDLDFDPRVTRFGRVLRASSVDELPQLVNVLRGEMSLVGPRPLMPVDHARVPPWARRRDDVPPGITGLWQVAGRTSLSFTEMLRLDCRYVDTWSVGRDLLILVRTVPAVLSGKGAN